MGRTKKNLDYLQEIGVIKDFIADTILEKKKIRRYLLDLAVMHPFIMQACNSFDNFLELNRNKKAKVFLNFIEYETSKRIKINSEKNYNTIRNRVLRIMWGVQGFLGYLSANGDLRANNKLLETYTPMPSLTLQITMGDVFDLYDELPSSGRRRLEIQTLTGWNNIDLIDLKLDDFQSTQTNDFMFIAKSRHKTRQKKVFYLNIVDYKTYWKYEKYCNRYDINSNEPIFPVTPQAVSKMYRFYLKKNQYLNQYTMPKHIRQLTFTTLRPIFQGQPELFNLYTQHSTKILTKHYIKDNLDRLIELWDPIKDSVLLESLNPMTLQLKEDRDKLKTDIEQLQEQTKILTDKVNILEQNQSQESKIDEILKILKKQ